MKQSSDATMETWASVVSFLLWNEVDHGGCSMIPPQEGTVGPTLLLECQFLNLFSLWWANPCVLFSDLSFAKKQAAFCGRHRADGLWVLPSGLCNCGPILVPSRPQFPHQWHGIIPEWCFRTFPVQASYYIISSLDRLPALKSQDRLLEASPLLASLSYGVVPPSGDWGTPPFSFGLHGTLLPPFSRKETEGLMTISSPLGVGISLQSSSAGSGVSAVAGLDFLPLGCMYWCLFWSWDHTMSLGHWPERLRDQRALGSSRQKCIIHEGFVPSGTRAWIDDAHGTFSHFFFPFLILSGFVFILRQKKKVQKNKWVAKFKKVLNFGILFGFILVKKEEEIGCDRGMCLDLFFQGK